MTYDKPRYGSDVMVDAMKAQGLKYVSLNPGSSFRGLHDSIVNYGGNSPEIIECPHEKVAVGVAHGYAKASGEAMGVILHNVVGLLQGTMGIYYAYIDRTPVVVFGGTGPMALERRRPNIDWIHTANVQGNVVREYTKWDDQPATIRSVPETVARAYRIANSEPAGPVYICLDAGLQEDELTEEIPGIDPERYKVPARIGPDPAALEQLAQMLVAAQGCEVVKDYDWVLTAGTASGWAHKTWDFDKAYRHPGDSLGTATQISMSIGVALAHKDSGKLVVDLQPDGDLMFDPGALWVAAYHKIPMLVVMFNNRAYYNDWEHQERIAKARGTDVEKAYLGMEIDDPAPDFANIARSFGWYGEGPIDDPSKVREAVRRAAEVVMSTGQPALVDVVCQHE